jgi:hypothetical protein
VRVLDVSDHRIAHAGDDDLFDVKTLLEVLSSALGNTQSQIAPENGDNVLFEGKSFFFVEDYHPPEDSATSSGGPRRLSIELSFQTDTPSRRLSIEKTPQGAGRQSRRFSLERTPQPFKNPSRQPRRFSIERAPQNTARQSRRFSLERSNPQNYVLKEIQSMTAV